MKEYKGRVFKVKPENDGTNIHEMTFRLLDVDDECCTIEWVQDKTRITKMYTDDLEYFFEKGSYYWV